jgi:hypothetical protein
MARLLGGSTAGGSLILTKDNYDGLLASGGTLTGNLGANDNIYISVGAANDLQLYHDGTRSVIQNTGSDIWLRTTSSNDLYLGTNNTWRWYIEDSGGHLIPYADSTYDIGTSLYRVRTGYFDSVDVSNTTFGDHIKIERAGYYGFITEGSSGNMYLGASDSASVPSSSTMMSIATGGNVVLPNNVYMGDSKYLYLGTGSDFKLYHDGANSYIENSNGFLGIGNSHNSPVYFKTNNTWRWNVSGDNGHWMPYVDSTYDIGTSATRVRTGYFDDINSTSALLGNGIYEFTSSGSLQQSSKGIWTWGTGYSALYGRTGNELRLGGENNPDMIVLGSSRIDFTEHTHLPDSKYLYLGTGNDLQISHDGTNTAIRNYTGDLYIITNNANHIYFRTNDTNRWQMNSTTGDLVPVGDNTYGLGSSGNRLEYIYTYDATIYESLQADSTGGAHLEGFLVNHMPESAMIYDARLVNDLSYVIDRGYTVTDNYGWTDSYKKAMFDPTANFCSIAAGSVPSGGLVITVNTPVLAYGAYCGIGFGNSTWRFKAVKIEAYRETLSDWQTLLDITDNSEAIISVSMSPNDGAGITQIRYTLDDPNTTSCRITNLFAYDYNSELATNLYVTRNGSTIYDNGQLKFGNGDDLRLYHDGSDSRIANYTGNLYIGNDTATTIYFKTNSTSRWAINNAGTLYPTTDSAYDIGSNSLRVSTGYFDDLTLSNDITVEDNGKVIFGTGSEGKIYSNGTSTYFEQVTGALHIKTNSAENLYFGTNNTWRWYIQNSTGHLIPYADSTYDIGTNSVRVLTGYFDDLNISDDLITADNSVLKIGSGSDLQIHHNGSHSYISQAGTGNLYLGTTNTSNLIFRTNSSERWIINNSIGGHFIPATDSTYDIGTSTVRPANIYTDTLSARDVVGDGTLTVACDATANMAFYLNYGGASGGYMTIGDINENFNGTRIRIDDSVSKVTIGDTAGMNNSTTLVVDDANLEVTISESLDVAGNITVTGTVDGVDVANHQHKFMYSHNYTVPGDVEVATLVPFFVPVMSGTTVKVTECRYKCASGSGTISLRKNGSSITGFTSMSVSTTAASTNPTDVTLADNDYLDVDVEGSSSMQNLTCSIYMEVEVTTQT